MVCKILSKAVSKKKKIELVQNTTTIKNMQGRLGSSIS